MAGGLVTLIPRIFRLASGSFRRLVATGNPNRADLFDEDLSDHSRYHFRRDFEVLNIGIFSENNLNGTHESCVIFYVKCNCCFILLPVANF